MHSKETTKICACVILYNPDSKLCKRIESYINEIDQLYILDNSECYNENLHNYFFNSQKGIYIYLNGNKGVAEALNIACKKAIENNYRWMLTMDQDSSFIDNVFFGLPKFNLYHDIAIYSASYGTLPDRWVKPFDANFDETHFVITSGNLINLKFWQDVGGFENKLFIDEVDHDFCLKLKSHQLKIVVSKAVLLSHTVGEIEVNTFRGQEEKAARHKPFRYYYISRNALFICKKNFFKNHIFVLKRLYYLLKVFIKISSYYPNKTEYLKYFFQGIYHFVISRYGPLDENATRK